MSIYNNMKSIPISDLSPKELKRVINSVQKFLRGLIKL